MNKFDLLVREAILNYPTLFKSRLEVMTYMFLTVGGSYAWEDSVLIHDASYKSEDAARAAFFSRCRQL